MAGFHAHTALDAPTALHTLHTRHIDGIILDWHMPALDGMTLLRQLRAEERLAPVAIVTGEYFLEASVVRDVHAYGASIHFKPLYCQALVGVAEQLAGNRRSQRDRQPCASRCKLLRVDDCAAERQMYECALETEFTMLTASRGDEGLALASRIHPDIIILDVEMPSMDGWETCRRIKSDPRTADIPVIFLTGVDDVDASQHAAAVGASALLRKTCPLDQLRDTVLSAAKPH